MQRVIVSIVIAVAGSPLAQARIGETEDQIQARYGAPMNIPPQAALMARNLPGTAKFYRAADLLVAVGYLGGKSAVEVYSKSDSSKLSDDEMKVILDANSGGAQWTRQPGVVALWQLAGTDRIAVGLSGALMICTQSYLDSSKTKGVEDAKEKLKKF